MKPCFLAFALLANISAQQAVKVQGRVLNSVTQEPLNGVNIGLLIQGKTYSAESANGGQFSFMQIGPGKYVVTAQRDGFRREVQEGESQQIQIDKDLTFTIKMEPLCAISGKITDSDGDPIRNASIGALRYSYLAGRRVLLPIGRAESDDRGEYRIFGLIPGKYYIRAASQGRRIAQQASMNAQTYFPGTTEEAEAATVNLGPGSEAGGIDIALRPVPVFKVRGTLPSRKSGNEGPPVRLIPVLSNQPGFGVKLNDADGMTTFEFSDVPSGAYILVATRQDNGHVLYARQNVQVAGANVEAVALSFLPAFDVTGRVVFEGAPETFEGMRVRLGAPARTYTSTIALGPLKADGTFVIHDVSPEVFELTINNSASTYLKFVQLGKKVINGNEVDYTHGPAELTLVLASDFGSVKGTVKNEKGEGVPHVRVTAIPVDRFVTTDENGNFEITKLPPGDYKLFAWDKVEAGAPQNPDFRKPYEKQGREVHVASNGHETADLMVVHVVEH